MPENVTYNGISSCIKIEIISATFGLPETIIWSLVSLATIVGNLYSILKTIRMRSRRSGHNWYVLSLYTSNLIIGATAHPSLASITLTMHAPCVVARILQAVVFFNFVISFLSSLAIAVNRYLAMNIRNTRVFNRVTVAGINESKRHFIVLAIMWSGTALLVAIASMTQKVEKMQPILVVLFLQTVTMNVVVTVKMNKVLNRVHPHLVRNSSDHKKNKASVRLLLLLMLNMILIGAPVIIVNILRKWKIYVGVVAWAIAYKVFMLGPLLHPLSYVMVRYGSR